MLAPKIFSSKSPSTSSTMPTNSAKSKSTTTASGSLTSTPSKLIKPTSDTSNLNSVSTATASVSTSATFSNQDNFISSIPERANDSTLVGNHHNSKTNLTKPISNNIDSSNVDKTNCKTPQTITNVHNNIDSISNETQTTTASSNANSSSSSTSSANVNAHSTHVNTQPINNMLASMFSNTSLGSTNLGNDIVPVAFVSVSAFQQMMLQQKLLSDSSNLSRQSIESNVGSKIWVNTAFPNSLVSSSGLGGTEGGGRGVSGGVLSSYSSPLSSSSIIGPNKLEIPYIELNESTVSFGAIAEGCSDFKRVFFKLGNPNSQG